MLQGPSYIASSLASKDIIGLAKIGSADPIR
jgi:hypothetical protein